MLCMPAYVQVTIDRTNVNPCPMFVGLYDPLVYNRLIVTFLGNSTDLLYRLYKLIPLVRRQRHSGLLSAGRHELLPINFSIQRDNLNVQNIPSFKRKI